MQIDFAIRLISVSCAQAVLKLKTRKQTNKTTSKIHSAKNKDS